MRRTSGFRAAGLLILLALAGCGDDEKKERDVVAPARVTDLAVSSTSTSSVGLLWTAPGDDEAAGRARAYDLRHAASVIVDSTWDAAVPVEGEPVPGQAGSHESFMVTGLQSGRTYHFALRVSDDAGNTSPVSNDIPAVTRFESESGSWWEGLDEYGTSGPVSALASLGDRLVAGGQFTEAGNVEVRNVASFDGNLWRAVAPGVEGEVYAMVVIGGDLYLGGIFDRVPELIAVHNITRWDGSQWSALGDGTNSTVNTLVEHDGVLVAGGSFTRAGGRDASYVASWDGGAWNPMPGLNGAVYALAVYQGTLVAGGRFTEAGGATAHALARWDGTAWSPFPGGVEADVPPVSIAALLAWGNDLYVGGRFDRAGGVDAPNLARWDGGAWQALGSGADGPVLCFATYRNRLFAGGSFEEIGGTAASGIATWDGSVWHPLGSGPGGGLPIVSVMTPFQDRLFVGGRFTTAGEVSSPHIAAWTE